MGINDQKFLQNETEKTRLHHKESTMEYICGTAIYSESIRVDFLKKAVCNVRKKVLKWLPDYGIYKGIKKSGEAVRQEIPVIEFTDEIEYERYIYQLSNSLQKELIGGLYQVEIVLVAKRVGILVILKHAFFEEKVFQILFREIEKEYLKYR